MGLPPLLSAREVAELGADATVVQVAWGPTNPGGPFVPGAVALDTDCLETGYPAWRLRPPEELAAVAGSLGIRRDRPVVVAGATMLAAARTAWVLCTLGHPNVAVLNGGMRAWVEGGFPVWPEPAPADGCLLEVVRDERVACWDDEVEGSTGRTVVDVRSADEFAGKTSGYRTLAARGRIPGSRHGGDFDEGSPVAFRSDGTLLASDKIGAWWERTGIPLDQPIVFVCGGGWRACLAFLVARQLGLDAAVMPNGWSGWSTRFVADPEAGPPSPGWRQEPTGRAVERD